jgi:putative flippase GtrA
MSLARQSLGFLLVGGIQLLVDWSVFVAATHGGMAIEWGNLLGRVSGACLGFWLNGRYTFAETGRSRVSGQALWRFGILWLATTGVSTLAVSWLAMQLGLAWAWLGKPAVEALLAAASFLVSRHWIYRT